MSKTEIGLILAIAYLRVSKQEQADKNLSIPAQRRQIEKYAREEGIKIVAWFSDEGESAYTENNPQKRKGFQDMIARVKKGDISEVIIWKGDRFSRRNEISVVVKAYLRRLGIKVNSVMERFDTDTPSGKLMEGMIDLMAQFFSDNLSTEVKKGQHEKAAQGNYPGKQAPYGYMKIKTSDGKTILKPNPETAPITIRILKEAAAGNGSTSITKGLNADGIPGPRGGKWNRGYVGEMCRNRIYLGHTPWGTGEERTEYKNTHKPLIDEKTYKAIIKVREGFTRAPPGKKSKAALLSGLIRGYCGHKYYTHSDSRRWGYYLCSVKQNEGKGACEAPNVSIPKTDDLVMDMLLEHAITPDRLAKIRKGAIEALGKRDDTKEINAAHKRLSEIDAERSRLAEAVLKGMLLDKVGAMERKLLAEQKQLRDRIAELEETNTSPQYIAKQWDNLETFAASLRKNWGKMPADLKRRAVLAFVESVTVKRDKSLTIVFRYPGGNVLPPVSTGSKGRSGSKSKSVKRSAPPWRDLPFDRVKTSINPGDVLARYCTHSPKVRRLVRDQEINRV